MIASQKLGPAISQIHVTPIAVTDPPLLNAAGIHAPFALRTIVELVTEDGISGISEIPGSALIDQALKMAGDLIVGKDPFQVNLIRDELKQHFGSDQHRGDAPWDQRKLVHVFSAIEVACLDIAGKVVNRPVCDLLGGKRREQVPYAAYLFYKKEGAGGEHGFGKDDSVRGWAAARQEGALDPAGIVKQARSMCESFGFRSIKLKGGAFPPPAELEAVKALFDNFTEMPIRFDPNAAWSLDTATGIGKEMEKYLEYLEDPVRGQENMALLRRQLKVPLATNMCTTSFGDLPSSIALGSEDIILSDHHFWGGLQASMQLSVFCEVFGRKLSMHSNSHLGISLAAMTHLGAALPEVPFALDTHYPWQSEEIIQGGRFQFEEGSLKVPSGSGLGVELDRQSLERLHQNYLQCGIKERDDEAEMQKLDPRWKFEKTRW
ncbi:MAG: glucarate dehydratase [Saprospiraceae bacterium]|nr:glucarate dehydratase [Saprospiraceae bacterium]